MNPRVAQLAILVEDGDVRRGDRRFEALVGFPKGVRGHRIAIHVSHCLLAAIVSYYGAWDLLALSEA